jgi:hypothetical protein
VCVCVCVCVCRRFYTCVLIYRQTDRHTHSHTCMYVCIHTYIHTYIGPLSETGGVAIFFSDPFFFAALMHFQMHFFRCRSRTAKSNGREALRRDILTRTLILYLIYYTTTARARVRMALLQLLCSKLGTKSIVN